MSQIIKKINIEDLSKNRNLNTLNSYNTKTSEIKTINLDAENANIEQYHFEAKGWIEDIHDAIFPPTIQDKLDEIGINTYELGEMIHYHPITVDGIESITDCGPDGENRKIIINDDEGQIEVLLVKENGEYIYSSIKLSDGTTIYCNLSESEKQRIRDSIGLSDDVEINGYSELEINGKKVYSYWVGDDCTLQETRDAISCIKEGLNNYPSNMLNRVFNSDEFKGFFIGTEKDAPETLSINWAAYACGGKYIFVDRAPFGSTVIPHEFTHILDNTIGYFSDSDSEFRNLYNKYKKQFQQAFDDRIGYTSSLYPNGIPNNHEFFAEVISIYLETPEEIESLFPDLYVYIDDVITSI